MDSTFPPEIWETIFHEAAGGPLNKAPPLHTIHFHYHRHDLEQRRVRKAVVTKLRLAQVCRDWRALVEPLLYGHIVLKRFTSLDSLIPLMREGGKNDKHRGKLVQRLDIVAPNDRDDTDQARVVHLFSQLQELLRLLPKLKTLVVRHSFSFKTGAALEQANFLSSVAPTLETISWIDEKWDYSLLRVPEFIWTPFLDSHPNLQSIHRPKVDIPTEIYWGEPESSLLSTPMDGVTQIVMRLEWMLARPDLYLLPPETGHDLFPNLRHVLFQMPIVGPMDMEMMGGEIPVPTMLEVHGHKITSLDCAYHEILSDDSPQMQFFPMIAQYCSNLEELGLFFNWKSRIYTEGQQREDVVWNFALPCNFPTVKKLKVRRMNRRFDVGAYGEMLAFVRRTVVGEGGMLPSCTAVQFVSERDVVYFSKHRGLLDGHLNALVTQGLLLLDRRGCLLSL